MHFKRELSRRWHAEVPGARWFKADLHVHTIDDWPGKRAKMPSGLAVPDSPDEIRCYARHFLAAAIANGVQVLGLTPHSARIRAGSNDSAVWTIVDEWNRGLDDDGTPFRDKIYAVFPGFEPSLNEGREGLHLIFLFDPEIGQHDYLKAFDIAMGGLSPWQDTRLRMSQKRADEVFRELRDFRRHKGERPGKARWQYVVLAPHMDGTKGLLGAKRAQVLQYFQSHEIAGLELGDDKLPHEVLSNREWLAKGMKDFRQAFYHGTDAYAITDIGRRHTWFKLARPSVEALRQAFIANESRIRIGFERDNEGALMEIADPPDVMLSGRGWLKSVVVKGRASFFGGSVEGNPTETRFRLSPDLTCVIGGSMTGKSTFLDGLRHQVKAPLPTDPRVLRQVQQRADERFQAGGAEISLEIPGTDPTGKFPNRWPADFFAQNELQRLAEDAGAVEDILARLVQSETAGIRARDERLGRLDAKLSRLATRNLRELDAKVADVEQECQRCRRAKRELEEFRTAGVQVLNQVSGDLERLRAWMTEYESLTDLLAQAADTSSELGFPGIESEPYEAVAPDLAVQVRKAVRSWDQLRGGLGSTVGEFRELRGRIRSALTSLAATRKTLYRRMERHLAAEGISATKIREFDALSRRASLLPANESHLALLREQLDDTRRKFDQGVAERDRLVRRQRDAYDRVADAIHRQFGDRILVGRVDNGRTDPLDRFLRGLAEKGITRWWNGLSLHDMPNPKRLLRELEHGSLEEVGMSPAVASTFRETMTRARRLELAAVRCFDRYTLEMNLEGSRRELSQLSGGQRVSVVLSLLLEATDSKPLVIDQPEDELDNRFLFNTVLPALKRLKGRRQIILATHNANIVVNGDADQVIQLDASASRGWIEQAGAIEDPSVRDAIVATVDGGDEAFQLRYRKYGF